jgi:integrase
MQRNPLEVIKLKGSSQRAKEIVILTVPQYQRLLDDPELPELVKVIVQVTAALGLRISETLGLKWMDLDFEAGTVEIQRGVVGMEANDVKTPGSRQKLPLHPELIDVLRTWRATAPVIGDWVFGSDRTGRPYDRDYMRSEYLKPAGARIGLPGIGWHSFRHTYRALQKQLGLPMETQKALMRHSRIATTIDTYGGNNNLEQTRPANSRVIEMLPWRRRA